jgi:hypothetical protein
MRLRKRPVRRAATLCGVALTAAALALAPAATAEETVLWMGGTGGTIAHYLPPGLFGTPDSFLGGEFRNHQFTVVDYPSGLWPITGLQDPTLGASVDIGTASLVAAARATVGPLVLAGVSQGAMVVQQAQVILDSDPAIASDTTFILIADPNIGAFAGAYGRYIPIVDYTPRPAGDTRFTTIVVSNQYDGFGDPIRRPWNLLTVANAFMGLVTVHPFAQNSDLAAVPAGNITTTVNSHGGTTISYRVPTRQLPLTTPLRQLGVPSEVVDNIDTALRPIIDSGYQPWLQPQTSVHGPNRPVEGRRAMATTASARTAGSSSPHAAAGTSGRHSPAR